MCFVHIFTLALFPALGPYSAQAPEEEYLETGSNILPTPPALQNGLHLLPSFVYFVNFKSPRVWSWSFSIELEET